MKHSTKVPNVYFFSYIASIEENSAEGTTLSFVGGFDRVQDFDKVKITFRDKNREKKKAVNFQGHN